MGLVLLIIIFIGSLALLVKGADWLLDKAEKIGLSAGLSPFIVGVTIVALGTSFPELISGFFAAADGVPEIVAANAIGSNLANIFLIVGISALVARKLVVTKSLIDLDLPLLAISTVLLLGILWDREVVLGEAILLLVTYGIYFFYTLLHQHEEEEKEEGKEKRAVLPAGRKGKYRRRKKKKPKGKRPKLTIKDFIWLGIGIAALAFGAKYVIDSVVGISEILEISPGIIAITAIAFGTSLPELIVSIKAALRNKAEVALGNIFGSNVFNALVVIGLPGLFYKLPVDDQTFMLGIPAMALATLLFVISGISRRIHIWEGAMYLVIYALFIGKLLGIF
ncbi:calcium/sodium antiporter [Patescibacteria group bacterium]